jgi:hypothetical protein
MTPEQRFNNWVIERMPADADIQRIENTTENGVPDMNICRLGMEIWVESKVLHSKGVLLRKEQFAWGMRRSHSGGTVVVLCDDPQQAVMLGFRFPDIRVRPLGDQVYVIISSPCHLRLDKYSPDTKKLLWKFLFPAI